MSKERARRRAERVAAAAKRDADHARKQARRAKLRAARKSLRPERGRVGRIGSRYSRGQVRMVVGILALGLVLVFLAVPSWPLRIALGALAIIGLPALLTLTLDRSPR